MVTFLGKAAFGYTSYAVWPRRLSSPDPTESPIDGKTTEQLKDKAFANLYVLRNQENIQEKNIEDALEPLSEIENQRTRTEYYLEGTLNYFGMDAKVDFDWGEITKVFGAEEGEMLAGIRGVLIKYIWYDHVAGTRHDDYNRDCFRQDRGLKITISADPEGAATHIRREGGRTTHIQVDLSKQTYDGKLGHGATANEFFHLFFRDTEERYLQNLYSATAPDSAQFGHTRLFDETLSNIAELKTLQDLRDNPPYEMRQYTRVPEEEIDALMRNLIAGLYTFTIGTRDQRAILNSIDYLINMYQFSPMFHEWIEGVGASLAAQIITDYESADDDVEEPDLAELIYWIDYAVRQGEYPSNLKNAILDGPAAILLPRRGEELPQGASSMSWADTYVLHMSNYPSEWSTFIHTLALNVEYDGDIYNAYGIPRSISNAMDGIEYSFQSGLLPEEQLVVTSVIVGEDLRNQTVVVQLQVYEPGNGVIEDGIWHIVAFPYDPGNELDRKIEKKLKQGLVFLDGGNKDKMEELIKKIADSEIVVPDMAEQMRIAAEILARREEMGQDEEDIEEISGRSREVGLEEVVPEARQKLSLLKEE